MLKNVIQLDVGKQKWTARPRTTGGTSVGRAISALFSTDYELVREGAPDRVAAHVSYSPKRDEIVVHLDEERFQTKASRFGPMRVELRGVEYLVHEKITGRFAILRGESVIAEGQCRFRSVSIPEYPAEIEEPLGLLALGLLIRTLFWELAF